MTLQIDAMILGSLAHIGIVMMIFSFQQIEMFSGRIPKRGMTIEGTNQKFLYWQDFYCQKYGNIGLATLLVGFLHVVKGGFVGQGEWLWFIVVAFCSSVVFTFKCFDKKHKPDYGFPEVGKINLPGSVHSLYYGLNIGMALVCISHWVSGEFTGVPLYMAVGGGIFYHLTNFADSKAGHFDQIKYQ